MTRAHRRVHLVVWLLLAPVALGVVIGAALVHWGAGTVSDRGSSDSAPAGGTR